ncbi:hypothetical protein HDK77DRAFT_494741 [Phyllosticta capitalensis]|uniref:Uncharacterized protein n=1 Tax=Phyllosticta capitalensis TaxID=121624 RepID=A0ABR1YR86_9PEZI
MVGHVAPFTRLDLLIVRSSAILICAALSADRNRWTPIAVLRNLITRRLSARPMSVESVVVSQVHSVGKRRLPLFTESIGYDSTFEKNGEQVWWGRGSIRGILDHGTGVISILLRDLLWGRGKV